MTELRENIKKYLLVKYADTRLAECTAHLSKSIPWIQRKSLKTFQTIPRLTKRTKALLKGFLGYYKNSQQGTPQFMKEDN